MILPWLRPEPGIYRVVHPRFVRQKEMVRPRPGCDRPDDRRAIHVGVPVASRQSRILRVDAGSVAQTYQAGAFPAAKSTP